MDARSYENIEACPGCYNELQAMKKDRSSLDLSVIILNGPSRLVHIGFLCSWDLHMFPVIRRCTLFFLPPEFSPMSLFCPGGYVHMYCLMLDKQSTMNQSSIRWLALIF